MFRSPKLAKKTSLTHYSKIIQEIANWDGQNRFATIWKIDANKYNIDKTRKLLIECYEKLKEIARPAEQKADLTLTTKIMLGIFGCIPGFDIKVQKTFEIKFPQKFTIKKFDRALEKLGSFYNGHKVVIDKLAKQTKTLDFATGKKTRKCYTRAKIIDMIGFQKAEKKNKR
jgi:hypothetical protein